MAVQVGAAENAPIQRKVIGDAVLYPLDQAAIVPKVVAPVKKFYVDRGSAVHAGEVLADLESADLAGAVTDNQGGVRAGAGDLRRRGSKGATGFATDQRGPGFGAAAL